MNTCEQLVCAECGYAMQDDCCHAEGYPHGEIEWHWEDPKPCGQPLQGRGPCATCGRERWLAANAHGLRMHSHLSEDIQHVYAPSEYVCEAGHVSKSAEGSEGARSSPLPDSSAHVEHA